MKTISVALYFTILAVVSAQPGYKYQQPQLPPAAPPASHQHHHHHHHSVPQSGSAAPLPGPISAPPPPPPQQPSALYSPVQSPPLQSFNPSPQIPLPSPPQEIPLPVPQAPPQQAYLPPQQNGAVSSISQGHQQQFVQQQQVVQFGGAQQQFGGAAQQQFGGAAQQQFGGAGQQQFGGAAQQQLGGGAFSFPSGGQGGFQQNFQSFQQPRQQTAIITKDIYIHSAPEDQEETLLGGPLENGPVRKNYRIVFIKAPTHNLKLASAALKHAQNANEEKTVIYVLSKKPDLTEVQQQLQQAQGQQKTHKPEVYFIKYKTQEEAQRAQQEIQAQYDALGGSTHISDEGIAPLTSVSGGSLNLGGPSNIGIAQQHSSFVQQNFQSAVNYDVPTNKYLPIIKKK